MSTAVVIVVFVVALVVSLGFLVLVVSLVPAIQQLRITLLDLERTSGEVRDLSRELKRLSAMAAARMEQADGVLASSKRTVETVGESLHFINQNLLRRSAGLLAFLPAIRLGWNLVKRLKGGK